MPPPSRCLEGCEPARARENRPPRRASRGGGTQGQARVARRDLRVLALDLEPVVERNVLDVERLVRGPDPLPHDKELGLLGVERDVLVSQCAHRLGRHRRHVRRPALAAAALHRTHPPSPPSLPLRRGVPLLFSRGVLRTGRLMFVASAEKQKHSPPKECCGRRSA